MAAGPAMAQTTTSIDSNRRATRSRIVDATFAGRLGGNQEFIADDDDRSLLSKQPDAAPLQSLSASINLKAFASSDLWRMALLEGLGTCLIVFLLGGVSIGLTGLGQSAFASTLYAALTTWFALSIFTFCLGPVSGGHLNPTITLATFFAGLSTLPRTILYILAQAIGALIAGFWLKLATGSSNYFSAGVIPGCTVDTSQVTVGQMFALEFMYSLIGVFTAFGVGLDPRQAKIYGPAFAPVLVGVTGALLTVSSAIVRPGYSGASFNPARCLGLMGAKLDMQYHWIHWIGPLAATMLNGVFYQIAPPWRRDYPLLSHAGHIMANMLQRDVRHDGELHDSHSR